MYARGAGSNLVLASPVTNVGGVSLTAEGSVTVNGNENVGSFASYAGTDFLAGAGVITTTGFGINIHANNNLNFSLAQFSAAPSSQLMLTAGNDININASANTAFFSNVQEAIVLAHNTLNFTGGTTLTWAPSGGTADFEAGAGGIQSATVSFIHPNSGITMVSGGTINLKSLTGGVSINATGDITTAGDLSAFLRVTTGGDLKVGGNLTLTDATSGAVFATGNITVIGTLQSEGVFTDGDVMANRIRVGNLGSFNGSGDPTLTAGGQGINPFTPAGPTLSHVWHVTTVQSHTAPVGIDFSGNNYSTTAGANGGNLILNAANQNFSSADGINGANFNGGDAAPVPAANPGDGGSFTVNADNIALTGTTISATTGIIDSNASTPLGNGGTVSLNGQTQVTFQNSTVQVSSSDAVGSSNRRSSAVGGNINVQATGTSGATAIQIDSTSQLLALLQNAPTTTGGLIQISTANGNVQVNGTVRADRGGVDIRAPGSAAQITTTGATLRGDIIKVAALGSGGRLTIGGGTIDADNILRLYASAGNGQVTFVADCNIRGGNELSIAANTVRIDPGVSVNVTGHIADVYTNNAQYVGGTNPTTGQFTGLGANTHLGQAPPPIGPPGGN